MLNGRHLLLKRTLLAGLAVAAVAQILFDKFEFLEHYKWHTAPITSEKYYASQSPSENSTDAGPCVLRQAAVVARQNPPDVREFKDINLASYVNAIAWSPNGRYLASSEKNDTVIEIWSFPKLKLMYTITKLFSGERKIIFTKDSRFLLTSYVGALDGIDRSAFSVIDVNTGKIVNNVPGPYDPIDFARANVPRDFRVSDDGKVVFVAFNNHDFQIYAYDTQNWKIIDSFEGPSTAFEAGLGEERLMLVEEPFATQPPDDRLQEPDKIVAWNEKTQRFDFNSDFQTAKFSPNNIAINETKCLIAVGAFSITIASLPSDNHPGFENGIRLWMPLSHKLFDLPPQPIINSLSFSPDGLLLAAQSGSDFDGKVNIFFLDDLDKSEIDEMTINPFIYETVSALFDPSGKYLALAGDRSIKILKIGE